MQFRIYLSDEHSVTMERDNNNGDVVITVVDGEGKIIAHGREPGKHIAQAGNILAG